MVRKIIKMVANTCHTSDFNVKNVRKSISAGLCDRPRWGSLQRSPRLPSWNKGDLLLKEEQRCREGKEARRGRHRTGGDRTGEVGN